MSKKKTTEEFIADSIKAHGTRYEYSKVDYKNNSIPVTIICKEHGSWAQRPNDHLRGQGCPKCSGNARSNTEEFINQAQEVHGSKYDYSKVDYKNNSTPVTIICKIHGEWLQRPRDHKRGNGCPKCSGNIKLVTEEFINKAKEVHGTQYDYSKVDYVNNKTKVCLICKEHGDFWQSPQSHTRGQGCPTCGGSHQLTTEDFIKKAKAIHGDLYDYSKVSYINSKADVTIGCSQHGWYKQAPHNHLRGRVCRQCAGNITYTTEEFITKAKEVHKDLYDYSKVNYVSSHTKITIGCKEHGDFKQAPHKHLASQGCPVCAKLNNAAHYYDKPTILYFVRFTKDNQQFLKIGITTKTVQERFAAEKLEITTLHTLHFETGQQAYTIEQYLLDKYKQYKTADEPLANAGNSEVLNHSEELETEIKSILKDINVRYEKN